MKAAPPVLRKPVLRKVVAAPFVLLAAVTGCTTSSSSSSSPSSSSAASPASAAIAPPAQASRLCGSAALNSPFSYHGKAGTFASGTAGLPTFGKPGTNFPRATAGVVLPAGRHSYASYQLNTDTVYYLLPGTHIGSFQARAGDAFVGGYSGGTRSVLSGEYKETSAIDSNFSDGNQPDVTLEYLTVQKFLAQGDGAAINQDSNTGWTFLYNTITLNAPGAGIIAGAGNTLASNCMTLNGQYGFQSSAVNSWGRDPLTEGPYNVTVRNNEISYNDTCDFEGLLTNPAVGWHDYNPVPERYRNPNCGKVTPNGNEGGFKLWQTNGATIKDNFIHGNWGPGAWVDTNNANTTFAGNTITSNDGEAIIEEISYNFSITGNYMAYNGWVSGLGNPKFPTPAIYVSQSGSERMFGGVPACPLVSCPGHRSYPRESVISGNTFVNNGGNVFLWQNSDRFCSAPFDHACTLVGGGRSGPFTMSSCKSALPSASVDPATYASRRTGTPPQDWWNGCMWWTANVTVTGNTIDFDPAKIMHCNKTAWPDCGAGGIFAEYGIAAPYNRPGGWAVLSQVTFFKNNTWSDNTYHGPSTFYAWNQGNDDNPVSWAEWTGAVAKGDRCSSAGNRESGACTGPFGQDSGSSYDPAPVSAPPVPAS